MRKSIARTALWNALLLGVWIFFFDLLIDLLVINLVDFAWLHALLVLSSVLVLFVSLSRDLRARERAEIALQRSHEQLEQRVRDRTTELNLTVEKLYAEIAERARVEEALRKLSRAVEHSPATVVITDTAGHIEYVNPRFTQTTGYSFEEVRGENPRLLKSGQTPAEVYAQLWTTILAGGQWQGELCNKKKSGELYWESTHISPITDENGVMTHFVAVKEDITARKLAEAERDHLLKQVEQARRRAEGSAQETQLANSLLHALIDTIPAGVLVANADGGVLLSNRAAAEIVGDVPTGVAHGQRQEYRLHRIDGAPFALDDLPMARALKRGQTTRGIEALLRRQDGSEVAILMAASPALDATGCVFGGVTIFQDITQRKQAEQQTNRLAVLEERQHLSRELHDSLSQALYGISLGAHTAVKWLDRDRVRVVEALEYVITLADAGLTEMRALIFELRPESLAREGLLNALTKQASAVGARNSLPVEVDLCGCEPEVPLAVKEAIYRIAQEALHNAVKHARAGRLRLHFTCQDDRLMLDVSDDGIGFDPAGSHPGHLGLHSMRERAARAGGTLMIDSLPGRGTCVHAEFPLPAA